MSIQRYRAQNLVHLQRKISRLLQIALYVYYLLFDYDALGDDLYNII